MVRLRAYLRELREGVSLLPEVIRLVFSDGFWAGVVQRYVDRAYTVRHFEEWAAWEEEAKKDMKD